jgi:hypothetical protein
MRLAEVKNVELIKNVLVHRFVPRQFELILVVLNILQTEIILQREAWAIKVLENNSFGLERI